MSNVDNLASGTIFASGHISAVLELSLNTFCAPWGRMPSIWLGLARRNVHYHQRTLENGLSLQMCLSGP